MIRPEKMRNALYALQGVLVQARDMAFRGAPGLADLLDTAELLPCFIASDADETDKYRQYLVEIARKHKCGYVLQRFDERVPEQW